MADTAKSPKLYWLLFLVSTGVMCLMLAFISEWFWVSLPFVLTFLVQALDKM